MKIQILAAVLLSSFALSTAYAADDAMPAGNNATPSAATTAATSQAADAATVEKKPVKKHKKHKKHNKHHKKHCNNPDGDARSVEAQVKTTPADPNN